MNYLREYGGKTFEERPFSEVDSLVLAEMTYFKFDGLVGGFRNGRAARKPVTLEDLDAHADRENMFTDEVYGKRYRKFFRLLRQSRRFRHLRMNYFINYIDKDQEIQFSAITFFLETGICYVGYRGTDETLVGWKEDFNMSYMSSVPSQRAALAYFQRVASLRSGPLMIGGHSKGGNLAVYVAANCEPRYQRRLLTAYSFDGPGFPREFYQNPGYKRIQNNICKIVPADTLIGMILDNEMQIHAVRSFGKGVIQHDPFLWIIKNGQLQYRQNIYRRASHKIKVLNLWIDSLSATQIQDFVEISYGILSATEAESVYEFTKGPIRYLLRILWAVRGLDRTAKKLIATVLGKLWKARFQVAEETGKQSMEKVRSSASAASSNRSGRPAPLRSRSADT
ncbi:MAG: DUF2974 domain-containing protein [Eubacteriales bacterium]|nr:DUF2974 domain-containing protein [Eubacteriales bacterium]